MSAFATIPARFGRLTDRKIPLRLVCLSAALLGALLVSVAFMVHDLRENQRRVEEAAEFLEGQSQQMIEQVETEMKTAAGRLDFEKAAQLRNLLDDLRATTKPMTRFTRKSLPSTIDPASAFRNSERHSVGMIQSASFVQAASAAAENGEAM